MTNNFIFALGANFFLGHSSHSVFVVNDHSPGTKIRLMQGRSHWFRRSNPISIKEVRSLNYKKDKRFTKIEGNIFHLTNSSIDVNRPNAYPKYQYYYIQVMLLFTECRLGFFDLRF